MAHPVQINKHVHSTFITMLPHPSSREGEILKIINQNYRVIIRPSCNDLSPPSEVGGVA